MRVLITGVGRSGASVLFRQLGSLAASAGRSVWSSREFYLWTPVSGAGDAAPDLNPVGLRAHTHTPLFVDDASTPEHDAFIDSIFLDQASVGGGKSSAWLMKSSLACGRLSSILKRCPELKVLVCLRNPIDTINSSLGGHALLNEAAFPNELTRFLRELTSTDLRAPSTTSRPDSVGVAGAWWRAHTAAALHAMEVHPDRVLPVFYEQLKDDPDGWCSTIGEFLGVSDPIRLRLGLELRNEPSSDARHIPLVDMLALRGEQRFYETRCMPRAFSRETIADLSQRIARSYREAAFVPPAQVMAERDRAIRLYASADGNAPRIDLAALVGRAGGMEAIWKEMAELDQSAAEQGETFGCVVVCCNNLTTLDDSIFSVLNQTRPFDEIVVVDDQSQDGSFDRLNALARMYPQLTVVSTTSQIGLAAAAELGFRCLDTDYITYVSAEDCFWPNKNALEAAIIDRRPNTIVVSNAMGVATSKVETYSSAQFAGPADTVFEALLSSCLGRTRNPTLPRGAFFDVGGFDLRLNCLQEWDLLLRLARLSRVGWAHSEGGFGIILNERLKPDRAVVDRSRTRLWIFMKNLRPFMISPRAVVGAFEKNFAGEGTEVVATVNRWLARATWEELNRDEPYELTSKRVLQHASESEYTRRMLAAFVKGFVWSTHSGFGAQEGPRTGFPTSSLIWKTEEQAAIGIIVERDYPGFQVSCYVPNGVQRLVFGLRDRQVALSVRSGDLKQLHVLAVNLKLRRGKNLVRVHSEPFLTERRGQEPTGRRLFFILSDVRLSPDTGGGKTA